MNAALNSSGPGFVLSLCPNTTYPIVAPLKFTFPNQEISTAGYPTTDQRATLVIAGPVFNGSGHTTAIDGTCANCSGAIIRNIQVRAWLRSRTRTQLTSLSQINGTRLGGTKLNGGANIEMGNNNANQLIEYVRSYDPRSWSCLHVTEGSQRCQNVTVQNNDIGPCGLDGFNQWADGISYSCWNGLVQNNMVNNPTDGGIVLFGAPGTLVRNNTIWIEKVSLPSPLFQRAWLLTKLIQQTLLGGINLVDYSPFNGSFLGVVVENNTIMGGFAEGTPSGNETKGDDEFDVIIKYVYFTIFSTATSYTTFVQNGNRYRTAYVVWESLLQQRLQFCHHPEQSIHRRLRIRYRYVVSKEFHSGGQYSHRQHVLHWLPRTKLQHCRPDSQPSAICY